MNVLVGYASAHGSTREIAERLAERLNETGLKTEARDVHTVDDADAYRAFVLGSAVHGQAWLPAAVDFVRDNEDILAVRPVWIFSVGVPGALRGPWKRMAPKEAVPIVQSLPGDLTYRSHRLLSGVITRDQLPRTGQFLFRLVGGRFGDFRDWAAIDAWASEIAEELTHG